MNRNPGNEKPAFHRAYCTYLSCSPALLDTFYPRLCAFSCTRGCIGGCHAIVQGQDIIINVCYVYTTSSLVRIVILELLHVAFFRDQLNLRQDNPPSLHKTLVSACHRFAYSRNLRFFSRHDLLTPPPPVLHTISADLSLRARSCTRLYSQIYIYRGVNSEEILPSRFSPSGP